MGIKAVASITGANDYYENLLSFWYVDIISEVLCQVQESNMKAEDQRALLAWTGYLHSLIQGKDATSREDVFRSLRSAMLQGNGPQQVKNMKVLADILYDIFANPFSFFLLRNILHNSPEILNSEFPYQITVPKTAAPASLLATISKQKKSDEGKILTAEDDKEKGKKRKSEKGKGDREQQEANRLAALLSTEDHATVEAEKHCYILPLTAAVPEHFFEKLFKAEIKSMEEEKNKKMGKKDENRKENDKRKKKKN
ncbi:uncharacterized protein [Periplaneta americana]|uniref:uncharacterized protein n=1 Tax=Periplaneta americana TaxID=6978 RepID=UPI0037E769DC